MENLRVQFQVHYRGFPIKEKVVSEILETKHDMKTHLL